MENLLAFVVFIVIAGISMAQKAREARKKAEEESRHLEELSRRPELPEATRRVLYGEGGDAPRPAVPPQRTDLPEATRRILYGDHSEIPTARPRGGTAAPVRPVVVARPAVPPATPDRMPRSPERPDGPQVRPPQMRPQPRPVTMPTQRTAPPAAPLRSAVPARKMAPIPATAAQTRVAGGGLDETAWAQTRREEREQRQAQARREVQARASRAADRRDHRLFAGGRALGRAIVLREVLGPPLGLRGSPAPDPRNAPTYW